jgi:diguanylate cyclase (GGDEF)-like protein/putative nucleotidyltransferase with HDIG domain
MNNLTRPASRVSTTARVYLGAVILSGITAVVVSVFQAHQHPLGYQWYMLAALTLVSGSATVQLPSIPASISISETFVIASVLLFGPAAGTVMVALDGLVISFWMAKRRPEWYRALFNMAAPAVSIWIAAQLLFLLARIEPISQQPVLVDTLLVPLVAFAVLYFGLNSWLIAIAVSFETRITPYRVWRENFLWLSLNYFSGASVALLLVVYTRDVDLKFIGVIVPLLLVLYFTFKTSMQRVEDSNRHLQQLNRLHVSTIETLAMAIDAKDQITHGHIRRVQTLAVGLANHMGVADSALIKAIEAAALLHDMGKLAVPEYILNKPGKLTPAEFERMKTHAAVGADILAAIDFPYPVTPIVRYHHENWDGTGYPTGLKGTDIPVGARILAVVDCFDALTSDRPYRPRLSNQDAIAILKQRRGSMYDPLIVDTFARVYKDIAPELRTREGDLVLSEISALAVPTSPPAALDDITASADEMLTLFEMTRALAGLATQADASDIIAKHLRRLVPFSLCVVYLFDADTNEIEAKHSLGDDSSIARGLRIALGQHLSGWVAANRQSILNSDPSLDFGDVGRRFNRRFRSCLSCPLVSGEELVGVLSLYSDVKDRFSEDHQRIVEVVAKQVAHAFKRSVEFDSASHDIASELPSILRLQQPADNTRNSAVAVDSLKLIVVTVLDAQRISAQHGKQAAEEVLRHVMTLARRGLRTVDILFRNDGDQFVALLNELSDEAAAVISRRMSEELQRAPLTLKTGETIFIQTSLATIPVPNSHEQLREALRAVRRIGVAKSDNTLRPSIH